MKKSNWLITVLIVVILIFLLWLWYFLGFNKIDAPLDLIVSVVWWVLIILFIILIQRAEKARKVRIRTFFVSEKNLYESELGIMDLAPNADLALEMGNAIGKLRYGLHREDVPQAGTLKILFSVRFVQFEVGDAAVDTAEREPWRCQGSIEIAGSDASLPFEDFKQLEEQLFKAQAQTEA